MKKLYALMVVVGLAGLVGCPNPKPEDKKPDPNKEVKLAEKSITVKVGGKGEVKATEGKLKSADAPSDSKLVTKVEGDKLMIDAKDAKEGSYEVTVKGEKGEQKLTVKVTKEAASTEGEKDLKLAKGDVDVKKGESTTVKVDAGKATKVEVDPATSKVTAKLADDGMSVTIDAKEAKKDDAATVKVTGSKGSAEIKVKVTE